MAMTRSICLVFFIACVVLGIGRAIAFSSGPVVTACYSFDGAAVETTYLDGGGAFYPGPSENVVERYDDGSFRVTHQTLFTPFKQRVYLPVVRDE